MTLLLIAALVAAPDDAKPAAATHVGGGAVVSPDAGVVFAPAKDGGVEALDAATGKVLWTNPDADRVAGAADKLVVGWKPEEKKPNAFRVVVIDAGTGKTLAKSDPVVMPDWAATASVGDRAFRIGGRAEGDAVIVAWQANAFYWGGARPTPEIERAARKEASGVVSVDPKSGKTAALDRKPKAEEFGGFADKVGGYEFRVTEMIPGFGGKPARTTTVTLTVLKGKAEQWSRQLAGKPWLPPPP